MNKKKLFLFFSEKTKRNYHHVKKIVLICFYKNQVWDQN